MSNAEKILNGALELPKADRARIARRLLSSLDAPEESGAEEAWAEELRARVAEVESGQDVLLEWSEVKARVLARLAEAKQ